MYVSYAIRIQARLHEIRIAVPEGWDDRDMTNVLQFAVTTALLEHSGYLPVGVTHAVA